MKFLKIILCIFAVFCVCFAHGEHGKSVVVPAVPKTANKAANDSKAGKKSIVCTIFPQYDWVKEILGDNAQNFQITYLLNSGIDMHNYAPSVKDVAAISNADLFIYVGGESDKWVEGVIKKANNKKMLTLALSNSVEKYAEEFVEGMQNFGSEEEIDEHIWLSLKNAQKSVGVITNAICKLDETNAETYRANAKNYVSKLAELDKKYEEMVKNSPQKTILFGDRFPFLYLVKDYGLNYYAAFVGCSAETEASFETIAFLSKKVDELGLKTILVTETSNKQIANTIKSNSKSKNAEILVMNACQSITDKHIAGGTTYLLLMTENLNVLTKALAK